jgi:HEAT repeat protein
MVQITHLLRRVSLMTKLSSILFLFCVLQFNLLGQANQDIILKNYIKELIDCPSESEGMSIKEVAIADSIIKLGEIAVPPVIKLLKHPKLKVRERASYIIRDIDGINESYLDALIESLERGQSWHASRIAKIGTPKAIDALNKELIKECEAQTQITYSFEILGEKGLPCLFNIVDCHNKCNEDLLEVVSTIFKDLGPIAQSVIFKLDSLAINERNSTISRKWAIICLGNIGKTAKPTEKDLYELSLRETVNFKETALNALQNMQSVYAVYPLLERLNSSKTTFEKRLVLRDLAEMRETANPAGNFIIPYLSSEDWEIRIAAAITLGYINYKPAVDSLINALNYEPDCRLNFVSAIALGKLRSKSSLQNLKWTQANHWNPMVRYAAKIAARQIEDTTFILKTKQYSTFGEEFFSYEMDMMFPWCDREYCKNEKELKLENGILLCTDRGEFGGNLKFIYNNGSETILSQGNFKSVYKIDNKLIAIAGLAHMGSGSGSIYKIDINENGSFFLKKILSLPGAPFESEIGQDGNLWINTYGGTVELTKNLKLKSIVCSSQKEDN